jgi:hypothetical protein
MARLVALLCLAIGLAACGPTAKAEPEHRYDRYSKVPSCENLSPKLKSGLKLLTKGDGPSDGAVDGELCGYADPGRFHVSIAVDLYPKRSDDHAVKPVSMDIKGEAAAGEKLSGDGDQAAYFPSRCVFHARDSNLVVRIQLMGNELYGPCDKDRLLRYGRDWTSRNFTK